MFNHQFECFLTKNCTFENLDYLYKVKSLNLAPEIFTFCLIAYFHYISSSAS